MSDAMRIDYLPLDEIAGADRNPKLHNYDEIKASIVRLGFRAPLSRDERTGQLVSGHGRLETLRRMHEAGEEMPKFLQADGDRWCVPVVCGVPFKNAVEAEAFIIADNRISAIGGWDTDGLNDILLEQVDMFGSLEGLGFNEDDLMNLADAVSAMPIIDDEDDEEPEDLDTDEDDDEAEEPEVDTDEIDEEFEPEITEPEFAPGDALDVGQHKIHCGDCVEVLKTFADNSLDSIVCDPPYGLGFMNKDWDCSVPGLDWAQECLRVLKPGGHIIAFASTRTVHRLAVSIEDAGFEIRDTISWLYWTGFPKSMNISKAIDQHLGTKRKVVGRAKSWNKPDSEDGDNVRFNASPGEYDVTAPGSPEAAQWDGWGTALKPAQEPAILARKPISEKTVAANVIKHGAGGLNIDACRIPPGDQSWPGPQGGPAGTNCPDFPEPCKGHKSDGKYGDTFHAAPSLPNVRMGTPNAPVNTVYGDLSPGKDETWIPPEAGRFPGNIFVCPKPPRSEKEAGLEEFEHASAGEVTGGRKEGSDGLNSPRAGAGRTSGSKNIHPTVKPVRLMRWLIKLVTPDGGTVLDTFLGSGTTMVAAEREGFSCIGIELDPMFATIAKARVEHAIEDQE